MVGVQNLPADTARVVTAMAYPYLLMDVEARLPGNWCLNAPLCGNLSLPHDPQHGARPGLEHEHPALVGGPPGAADPRQLESVWTPWRRALGGGQEIHWHRWGECGQELGDLERKIYLGRSGWLRRELGPGPQTR